MLLRFVALSALILIPAMSAAQDRFYWNNSDLGVGTEALGPRIEMLPIPILLGVEADDLTKNFGDPRGGGTRFHEGLDIRAPLGTPVVSPTDAIVLRVGNGVSSGIYVRTANPGGETFVYMHLIKIADGMVSGKTVKRGEVIGFVGDTGNAVGAGAHLHFEIRKNGATDPFPRLTSTFTLQERMIGVTQALERGGVVYASEWAKHFADTFSEAARAGIAVPESLRSNTNTVTTLVSPQNTSAIFGETNVEVVQLQKFLIAAATGPAATRLRNSGATGYFGPITRAALIEYQDAAELKPTGIVDEETRAQVLALNSSEVIEEENSASTTVVTFTRDLEFGMRGEDVRALQKFLNAKGYIVSAEGDGSPGMETDYFGIRTRLALSKYQSAQNISPAAGYFGPKTRVSVAIL